MRRREFLFLAAAAMLPRFSFAKDLPRDVKIVRIIAFDLPTKRSKVVGKNARLDVHGDRSADRIVRLIASDGTEGFGCCRADEKTIATMLDKSVNDLFKSHDSLGPHAAPLWDLAGKITRKPVYELLSDGKITEAKPVRIYDGSVYFSDLLEPHMHRWPERFKEEVDEILSRGHRAFKVKIGRGAKWMDRAAGDARDIEVLNILRKHAGRDVAIAVDANNGYDLDRTKKLLDALPDFNFDFIEEMFPEKIDDDLALKQFIRERKLKTLVADGETQHEVGPLKPFMSAKAIDLYQLDVNGVGIDGLMQEAALCEPHGGQIAPHTWGTLLGFYAQLHVAAAIPNFYSGEQDPLASDALIADGYTIKDGTIAVPDAPGFGLRLDRRRVDDIKPIFDLKGA
jgi:L-rhamnonate dehydratase